VLFSKFCWIVDIKLLDLNAGQIPDTRDVHPTRGQDQDVVEIRPRWDIDWSQDRDQDYVTAE